MKRNLLTTILVAVGCSSILLLASCGKKHMVAEEKAINAPSKDVAKVEKEELPIDKEQEGGGFKIDPNALNQELLKMIQEPKEMAMVIWLPKEYWRVSSAQHPMLTEAQAEEFVRIISPYMIIGAIEAKVGAFGGISYRPEADIRARIFLRDSQGGLYSPLSQDKIDPDTKNLLSMMKPMFENVLGPMGQNLHWFLFSSKNKKGQNIAEARREGKFSIKLGENEFRWRLPLASLLPLKTCPTCGQKLSGAYKFCPWDGTKLIGAN